MAYAQELADAERTIAALKAQLSALQQEHAELKRHAKADAIAFDSMNHEAVNWQERAEHLWQENERLKAAVLACHVCGRPAACIGAYEGDQDYRPACDSCCGHGNEDGRCWPLADAVTNLSDALKATEASAEQAEQRIIALEAVLSAQQDQP